MTYDEWVTLNSGLEDDEIRWPYGPPDHHCQLHETNGVGECNCLASDSEDEDWGF